MLALLDIIQRKKSTRTEKITIEMSPRTECKLGNCKIHFIEVARDHTDHIAQHSRRMKEC